ncbi:Transposable element Hobo transposase [Lucilia cuprina]|nr:Transposable element Hobo transposase [Lucilia cuprina]
MAPTKYNYAEDLLRKIANGELVLSANNSRSKCWNVFAKIEDLNGEPVLGYVYCRVCKKLYSFQRSSTTNLVRHGCYKNAYVPKEFSVIQIETPKLEISPQSSLDNEEVEYFSNNLKKLFTKWLIRYCRSYGLIQDDGLKAVFQEFIAIGAKFGSNINVERFLPSATNIASNVSELYEECLSRVKAEIALVKENGLGLAIDSWTEVFSKKTYMALTIHFLKNESLTYRLLGLRSMEGQTIAEAVETILGDFNCSLSNKTILVTNGKDNMKDAFKNYGHISCITHSLNNALQNSIEEVTEVMEIVKSCEKLVNFFNNSPHNCNFNRSLQSFSPNRWNSLYNMFISLENNWNEISEFLEEQNEQQRLNEINLNYLKAISKTLQPFDEAIECLEEENSATLHLVLVYLHELKKSCDTNDNEFKDFDFIEKLKQNLRYHLEQLVKDQLSDLHKIALFLYPPTNKLLQFSTEEKKYIDNECIRLMKSFVIDQPSTIKQEPETIYSPAHKRKKFFTDFVEPETSRDPNELIMQELQFYKYMRVTNSADFDVFGWWQQQKASLPLLYKLSCSILATPASSSSVQRIFSAASSLLCENTYDLAQNEIKVDQIMFIHANSEQDDFGSEFD